LRIVTLSIALILALPTVWLLGGCLQGTTAGAGLAKVVTPQEAAEETEAPVISVMEDRFAGVTVTRLQNNLLPDPKGSIFDKIYFDGTCIDHECHAIVHLAGTPSVEVDDQHVHLIIDGVVFRKLRGTPVKKVAGFVIEGSLVVHLSVEVLRNLLAAKDVEYQFDKQRLSEDGRHLDEIAQVVGGKLSRENVLNLREMLSLSGVDPWAAVPEEDRPVPTVGSPPSK
jgi:hypothetical protein